MEKALNLSEKGLVFSQADRAIASSAVGLGGTGGRLPACADGERAILSWHRTQTP
jgi:hypothetical protein